MKQVIVILTCVSLLGASNAVAQKSYLSLGTGLNNYNGLLGLGFEIGMAKEVSLRLGAGLGTWGTKIGGGLLFQPGSTQDWKFGIGYSSCSGLKDFKAEFEVSGGNKKMVTMDLLRVGVVNLTAIRSWTMKNENKFNLEFGYSIATGGSVFYRVKDGSTLSNATKKAMEILRPGGFVFALSYNFALN